MVEGEKNGVIHRQSAEVGLKVSETGDVRRETW